MSLSGKVALVTGASRGIGREIALALAREGAAVCCAATSRANAEPTAARIREQGGRAEACGVHVEVQTEVQALFEEAVSALGDIDILVNNAAITIPATLLDFREEDFDAVIGVNVKGPLFCSQEAARRMRARNHGGTIVHIGSFSGINAFPMRINYGTSKAAVNHITKMMAIELAEFGIRVNQVVPGYIHTDLSNQLIAQGAVDPDKMRARIPQHRFGTGMDVAEAVVYLSGEKSGYVTGSSITVDGGFLAYGFL